VEDVSGLPPRAFLMAQYGAIVDHVNYDRERVLPRFL